MTDNTLEHGLDNNDQDELMLKMLSKTNKISESGCELNNVIQNTNKTNLNNTAFLAIKSD